MCIWALRTDRALSETEEVERARERALLYQRDSAYHAFINFKLIDNELCFGSLWPRSDKTRFFAVRGAFFKLLSVGSERFARCLCAPGTSRFCRSALSAWSWKKATLSGKAADVIRLFFPIVQSNEKRAFCCGDESLPLLKKSRDCNYGWETFGVCRRLPGAVFFKVSANIIVYLTAKTKDFRALTL